MKKHGSTDRDALVGAVLAGGFGVGWALWAASDLSGAAAAAVRIGGIGIGAALVAVALVRLLRDRPAGTAGRPDSASLFRSRGYSISVAAEVVALFAGNAILAATGNGRYVAAWVALVVGVHFVGFGRLFASTFYWIGGALIAAAVVGAVTGVAVGTRASVEVPTGLIAAASLFVAGGWGLVPPDQS